MRGVERCGFPDNEMLGLLLQEEHILLPKGNKNDPKSFGDRGPGITPRQSNLVKCIQTSGGRL
jgi:hypothetical protein